MNCKICKNPISVDDRGYYIEEKNKMHGICNACWERMQEEEVYNVNEMSESSKTIFIKIINAVQLISCLIMTIISWNEEETLQGFIYFGVGLVLFAFIKGFTDIIDLLNNINKKINK